MHGGQYRQQLVLGPKRDMVLVHGELQLFHQRVEILAVDAQVGMNRLHHGAPVFAGAVEDEAELLDQLCFDALLIGFFEERFGARVIQQVDHEIIHDCRQAGLFAELLEDAGVVADLHAFLCMHGGCQRRAAENDAQRGDYKS